MQFVTNGMQERFQAKLNSPHDRKSFVYHKKPG